VPLDRIAAALERIATALERDDERPRREGYPMTVAVNEMARRILDQMGLTEEALDRMDEAEARRRFEDALNLAYEHGYQAGMLGAAGDTAAAGSPATPSTPKSGSTSFGRLSASSA
jgi:hypothetical protein